MNLSYVVACGLLVTLLSERMEAKPLTQAQQKVSHTYPGQELCLKVEAESCVNSWFVVHALRTVILRVMFHHFSWVEPLSKYIFSTLDLLHFPTNSLSPLLTYLFFIPA